MKIAKQKSFLLVALMAALFTLPIQAQNNQRGNRGEQGEQEGRRGGRQGMEQRMQKFFKDSLNITAEQAVKIKKISADLKKERDAFREEMRNGNGDRETAREKMTEMSKAYDTKILAILTPEQQVIYNREKERQQAMRKNRRNSDNSSRRERRKR